MSRMIPCADCGKKIHHTKTSLPEGLSTCLQCRRVKPKKSDEPPNKCADCGVLCWGERCRSCKDRAQIVRALDDSRLVRHQREHAAPGLTTTQRKKLLDQWKRQGKRCTYCGGIADTIDHVVPLVRGGTNHEGNLTPCCRPCNSSKAGYTVSEWRTGRRLGRMKRAPQWKRKAAKPNPIKAIRGTQLAFNICPECGALCVNKYCDARCASRYGARTAYRLKVGIPIGAALAGNGRNRTA